MFMKLTAFYLYFIGVLTAFFTAMYSLKLILFVFIVKTNIYNKYMIIQEINLFILFALFILIIFLSINYYYYYFI